MAINNEKIPTIGLVGCGAIAELFYLPALTKMPGVCEKMILADQDKARLELLSTVYKPARVTQDYHDLLGKVDGVILALPHSLHYQVSKEFLATGVDVMCEKPLAGTLAQAREMVVFAEANGAKLAVNQVRRLYPVYQEIHKRIARGDLGNLRSIRYVDGEEFSWPTASGFYFQNELKRGVLFDRGIHGLDAICWWLGGNPDLISFESDRMGGVEGTAVVKGAFYGCNIEVILSWLTKLKNLYQIEGEKGCLEGDINDWKTLQFTPVDGKKEVIHLPSSEKSYMDFGKKMMENFIEVVAGKAEPLVPAAATLPALEWIDACYQAETRLSMPWYEAVPMTGGNELSTTLVTGSTGFVGGWVVEGLHLRKFSKIRAGLHSWSSAARIARMDVEMMPCDILNPSQIEKAMRGVDFVVHCAVGGRDVILDGTRNVMDAALKAGVRRVVHISTAEVYGSVGGDVDELSKVDGSTSEYAQMKASAEDICWEYASKGLPVVILRPSIIYGPFGKSWTTGFAERLFMGSWGQFEEFGEGICNLVYVDDLVEAIRLSLMTDGSDGEAFNVTGPDLVTWNQYFKNFNSSLGLPDLRLISRSSGHTQAAVADQARSVLELLMDRYRPSIMNLYMNSGVFRKPLKRLKETINAAPSLKHLEGLYNRRAVYVTKKAERILDFQAQYDLDLGLQLSTAWLEQNGFPVKKRESVGKVS